ncbi:MAG: flagellar motor protein MotA, partial [Pseudomonadota bacterium]
GSLVLGFLELQATQAHNRFYNELEEWLSGITELSPGTDVSGEQLNRQLYAALFEMQRSLGELADRVNAGGNDTAVRELTDGVNQMLVQMRKEQDIVRQWADEQSTQQAEMVNALRDVIERTRRSA